MRHPEQAPEWLSQLPPGARPRVQAHAHPILGGMFGSVGGFVNPRILAEWRKQDVFQHYSAGTHTCFWYTFY